MTTISSLNYIFEDREEAIKIVDFEEKDDGSFDITFKSKELKKIVNKIRGHQVLVYCMTGKQRQGKSYLNDWGRRKLENIATARQVIFFLIHWLNI